MAAPTKSAPRELLPFQIVMAVTAGAIGGIIALLGELRDDFGFSDTEIGFIVAAGFLAAFVAQATLAQYADRGYGREMVTIGVAVSAVALFGMLIVDDIVLWVLSRALLGFAGGLIFPGLRRAATVLDPTKVGENLGRLVVGEVVGFMFGPVIAALLAEVGGIRLPFLVFAIGMVAFLPFAVRLPRDTGQLDQTGRRSSFDLLRNRRLQGGLLLVMGYFALIGSFEAVLPLMFRDRGGSTLDTGLAFTLLALPIAVVSTFAGRTADRVGPPLVATAGISFVAVVTMSYGFLPGLVIPIIVMTLVGVADGFGFLAAQITISRAVPEERQAGALGLMGAVEVLGAGIAAIPAALLYEHSGEELTWLVAGGWTLAMVALAWTRLRGTAPANTSGAEIAWTPLDRHPTPSD